MNPDAPRRFTIADGLILIAGLATGLGLIKRVAPSITPGEIWDALVGPREGWSLWYAVMLAVELGVLLLVPVLAIWTPSCLLLELRQPRPRWRRLRRQPGFVANLIATAVVVLTLAVVSVFGGFWFLGSEVTELDFPYLQAQLLGGLLAGSGVFWGWVTMWLCGVCRPSLTWTDRLGRFTGAVWVAAGALSAIYIFLTIR
jgi:hypothetical protein